MFDNTKGMSALNKRKSSIGKKKWRVIRYRFKNTIGYQTKDRDRFMNDYFSLIFRLKNLSFNDIIIKHWHIYLHHFCFLVLKTYITLFLNFLRFLFFNSAFLFIFSLNFFQKSQPVLFQTYLQTFSACLYLNRYEFTVPWLIPRHKFSWPYWVSAAYFGPDPATNFEGSFCIFLITIPTVALALRFPVWAVVYAGWLPHNCLRTVRFPETPPGALSVALSRPCLLIYHSSVGLSHSQISPSNCWQWNFLKWYPPRSPLSLPLFSSVPLQWFHTLPTADLPLSVYFYSIWFPHHFCYCHSPS